MACSCMHFEEVVKSYGEIPSIFLWKGNWKSTVNAYNDSSQAKCYFTMQVDPNAKPLAMLTLNRPASASKPCVAKQHRSVVHTSTSEKVHSRSHHWILLHMYIMFTFISLICIFYSIIFVTQIKTEVTIVKTCAMRCDATDVICQMVIHPATFFVWLLCLKGAESDLCDGASISLWRLRPSDELPRLGNHVMHAKRPHLFSRSHRQEAFYLSPMKKVSYLSTSPQCSSNSVSYYSS